MHQLFAKADALSKEVIGAAIEVHRILGPGLMESVYEKCLQRELELCGIKTAKQIAVTVKYKGIIFEDNLRCDLLVDDCLLVELKAVETIHPVSKAQLLSYMKLLDVPVGLLINFHEALLKQGVHRLYLPGSNQPLSEPLR